MTTLSRGPKAELRIEGVDLAELTRSVSRELGGRVDPVQVSVEVERVAREYAGARITQFVPIFVRRDVLVALEVRRRPDEGSP